MKPKTSRIVIKDEPMPNAEFDSLALLALISTSFCSSFERTSEFSGSTTLYCSFGGLTSPYKGLEFVFLASGCFTGSAIRASLPISTLLISLFSTFCRKAVYDSSSVLEVGPENSIEINARTIIPKITYIPID